MKATKDWREKTAHHSISDRGDIKDDILTGAV